MAEEEKKLGGGCLTGMASLLGAIIAIVVVRGLLDDKNSSTQVEARSNHKLLQEAASAVNKTAPKAVDAETLLERAFAGPGDRFTYQYKLINISSVGFDHSKLSYFASTLVAKTCSSQELQRIFSLGVTTDFLYMSNDGVELGTISINRNNCPSSQANPPTVTFPKQVLVKPTPLLADRNTIDITTAIDYNTPKNQRCWEAYQKATSSVAENASLGHYASVEERAKKKLSQCVTRK